MNAHQAETLLKLLTVQNALLFQIAERMSAEGGFALTAALQHLAQVYRQVEETIVK